MTTKRVLEQARNGKELLLEPDMPQHSKKVLDMFTGEMQTVRLRFENHLVGTVIDRFGRDMMMLSSDENHFTVSADVTASPRFFAWFFRFGMAVEMVYPQVVHDEFKTNLLMLTEMHKSNYI